MLDIYSERLIFFIFKSDLFKSFKKIRKFLKAVNKKLIHSTKIQKQKNIENKYKKMHQP